LSAPLWISGTALLLVALTYAGLPSRGREMLVQA
jgi:hypothetical protein